MIEQTRLEDLPKIVECHKDAFPGALSTSQGNKFISKMMEWYIKDERGVLFHVNNDDGKMMGYCGGIITKEPGLLGAVSSISQYAFNAFVKSYLTKPWLFFHPENIKKAPYIIKNLLIKAGLRSRVQKPPTLKENSDFRPFMGLVVIGVKGEARGLGFGSKLLQEFEQQARNLDGIELIRLSVKSSNETALKAYLRHGWRIQYDGTKTKGLEKHL